MREGTLKDDNEHSQAHGDPQAHLNAQEQRAEEGTHPHSKVPKVGLHEQQAQHESMRAKEVELINFGPVDPCAIF